MLLLVKMPQRALFNTFTLWSQVPSTSLHQIFSTLLISVPLYTSSLSGIPSSRKPYQFFTTYDKYQFLLKMFPDSSNKKLNSCNTLLLILFSTSTALHYHFCICFLSLYYTILETLQSVFIIVTLTVLFLFSVSVEKNE